MTDLRQNISRYALWFCVIAYFAVFTLLALTRYNAYNMAMIDLGRMDQVIWNTLHGRFFIATFETGNFSRLLYHSEFIYLLIAPFYLVWSSPKTLIIIQALVVSLGAFPVFWLARLRLKSIFAAYCFALAYLLYPSLGYGVLIDFHPDMLATSFLLFTFYFLETRKWKAYIIFLILSLMCKEYVCLLAITLGLYITVFRKNLKWGLFTSLLGVFWFLAVYKFIPRFLNTGDNLMIQFYAPLGGSASSILKNIILHPLSTFLASVTAYKMLTLFLLFLPLGFLSLLNPIELGIALPIFLGLFLSPFLSYTNHHNGTLIPFIFISAMGGARLLIEKVKPRYNKITSIVAAFVLLASFSGTLIYGFSPLNLRFWDKSSYRYWKNPHNFNITEHDRITDSFIKLIPPEAAVSASNHLGAHLSQRQVIYHFPEPRNFAKLDYILVDLLEYFPLPGAPREQEKAALRNIITEGNFKLKSWTDGILLFQNNPQDKDEYLISLNTVKEATSEDKLDFSFDKRIRLLGFDLKAKDKVEGGYRFRVAYYWQVLPGFDKEFTYSYFGLKDKLNTQFAIIDKFTSGKDEFRVMHLPMYLLYENGKFNKGSLVKEEFAFSLPEDVFTSGFEWRLGMYVTPNYYFINTNRDGILPGTQEAVLRKRGGA
ncbi:MAG: DUF2079 domain-containing protein [Candidatus Omnitrophica bacterium]|nr:DUF2079 domain-containing protein [Candidatus Omnitrophota bacterium]